MLVVALLVHPAFTVCVKCFCIGTCISAKIGFDANVDLDVLDSNILETWILHILAMKLLNHFISVGKIGSRIPSLFTDFLILPMDTPIFSS